MHIFLVGLLIGFVRTQSPTPLDPDLIKQIWGTKFEDITVKPTEGTTTLIKDGESCQCVPYYLCDKNKIGVDINNVSITGFGELDMRFGDDCTESVEVCCTIPKEITQVPQKPKPDVSNLKGCGYRNPKGIGAFFNGAPSQFGEYPWVVALLDAKNLSYVGVGVIINPEVVMTGAHIAYKYAPGTLRIRAGEWDTQTVKEIFDYQERDAKEMYIHQDFNDKSLRNDIALLRLDRPLEFAEHINSICLPEQDEVFDSHKNCVANGWGKDVFGRKGAFAVILKKVEQDMVPYSKCLKQLRNTRLGSNFKLHSSFVCAGGEEGKDTCQGDGGAPLVCPLGNNRYTLTGLVAWGIGCGLKDVPSVYTNVPKFRNWVDDKMEDWGLQGTSYRIKEQ